MISVARARIIIVLKPDDCVVLEGDTLRKVSLGGVMFGR